MSEIQTEYESSSIYLKNLVNNIKCNKIKIMEKYNI